MSAPTGCLISNVLLVYILQLVQENHHSLKAVWYFIQSSNLYLHLHFLINVLPCAYSAVSNVEEISVNRAHNARVEAANLCLKITPLSYANSAESSSLPRLPLALGPLCKFAAFHANFKLPSSAERASIRLVTFFRARESESFCQGILKG